jgi:hypothetical protein
MTEGKIGGGWRIGHEYAQSKQASFVKRMTEECLAEREGRPPIHKIPTHFEGIPIEKLSCEDRERFIFSMQPKSTQDAITAQKTRDPKDDLAHVLRPMPNCIAVPEAENLDAATGKRDLPIGDVMLALGLRHSARNTRGVEDLSSLTAARRERGIQAFTYFRGLDGDELSIKDLSRLQKADPMEATQPSGDQPEEKPKKRNLIGRIMDYIFRDAISNG